MHAHQSAVCREQQHGQPPAWSDQDQWHPCSHPQTPVPRHRQSRSRPRMLHQQEGKAAVTFRLSDQGMVSSQKMTKLELSKFAAVTAEPGVKGTVGSACIRFRMALRRVRPDREADSMALSHAMLVQQSAPGAAAMNAPMCHQGNAHTMPYDAATTTVVMSQNAFFEEGHVCTAPAWVRSGRYMTWEVEGLSKYMTWEAAYSPQNRSCRNFH